jgi:predicted helicase
LPSLVIELRQLIEKQAQENPTFNQARNDFLELCRESINPHIVLADVREMLIQHILTEDIFITIFNNAQFHQENNIARELAKVVNTFFTGAIRQNIIIKIEPYIKIIKAAASNIYDHHEKQRFLKVIYENFYKAYNPAGADRLGIIYTPNEIVRFMIESADYLTNKHFGRGLGDKDVEILDPSTGTGTFITELIEYLPKNLLPYKYEKEIHCNEVAILPYYIANLNIEYTYAQKMGSYAEFKNICFVDTLDNLGFNYKNKQYDLLSISAENLARIKLQNARKISVIMGNPPYNANQLNENENNKNRPYDNVDKRIKETYITNSTAQKTKLYDMYARFIRWASDRLSPNGVLAFITNRSFINARTYDGFRKVVADEFSSIYVVDLGGDVRLNPKLSGPKHNVFAIQTGVAITFFVKSVSRKNDTCTISYVRRPEIEPAREKLQFLATTKLKDLPFTHIQPDKHHNWINLATEDWDELIPVVAKKTKLAKKAKDEKAIFKLYANGVVTARDEWVYDFNEDGLKDKIKFLAGIYNTEVKRYQSELLKTSVSKLPVDDFVDYQIKWSAGLKANLMSGKTIEYAKDKIIKAWYKPYIVKNYYFEPLLSDRLTQRHFDIFGRYANHSNLVILINLGSTKFKCAITNKVYEFGSMLEGGGQTIGFPLWSYDDKGNRNDNITDWALSQFQEHYQDKSISRETIFHYVYAMLYHPAYRKKYETNLKREFPRIPFYDDFWKWAAWGRELKDLHINFETASPYPLQRIDLKADKQANSIRLDTMTTLKDIPPDAWEYRLGNRSALEWVLEYYKERKPKDPTILQKFNTYRFVDYKDQVIDLLQRVCTVSVQTMDIIKKMGFKPS